MGVLGRKQGIFLIVLACAAFLVGLTALPYLRRPVGNTLCLRRPPSSSVLSPRRALERTDIRRCSGDAWPEPTVAPQALAGAAKCPRKVIFGNQRAWMKYVSSEFGFFFEALRVYHDWPYLSWFEPQSWDAVAKHFWATFGENCPLPKVLMFVEQYDVLPRLNASAGALRTAGTEIWLFVDDLHWHTDAQRLTKFLSLSAANLVLSTYAHKVPELYPELKHTIKVVSVPHSASPRFVVPLSEDPEEAILLSGSADSYWYPDRAAVKQRIDDSDARFSLLHHPGYDSLDKAITGCAYADAVRGFFAAITCGSRLNYIVAKIFEIPATGALLLLNADMSDIIRPLGFEPHVHYMPYTAETLDAVADAVLDPANRAAMDAVRRQGQELVLSRHTSTHRAAEIDFLAESLPAIAPR